MKLDKIGVPQQKFFAGLEIKNEKSYTVASCDLLAVTGRSLASILTAAFGSNTQSGKERSLFFLQGSPYPNPRVWGLRFAFPR